MKAKGQCLCGSVTLEAEIPNTQMGVCHCNMCRKWSGAPMMVVESDGELKISGEDKVSRYPSSEWAERGFCSNCGTHLFYWLKPKNQYHLPACLLDIESEYQFSHQIFVDEKPDFYKFANDTVNMTGAEVFAQFENG